jgi:hypothetical protein
MNKLLIALVLSASIGLAACGGGAGTADAPQGAQSSGTTNPGSGGGPAAATPPGAAPAPLADSPMQPPVGGTPTPTTTGAPAQPQGTLSNWSDPATWGGQLPGPAAAVIVPAGRTVLLDQDATVAGLTVEGELRFADKDIALTTGHVLVQGSGVLRIGDEARPYVRQALITLTGPSSTQNIDGMGTKFIGAGSGGRIDMHGETRRMPWTKLAAALPAGATTIQVLDATGWRVGDSIVIAAGSVEPDEAEVRSIASITGTSIGLDRPLQFARVGTVQTIDQRSVDLRSEVGLLSRNIVIQGDAASENTRFGGHVMIMAGGKATIDGVEFRHMGQFDRLGRYPFHWHLVGDASGQYLRNSAINGSIQRGIVVHGTQGALVSGNVVYDTVGHNIVAENDASFNNLFQSNLAVRNRIAVFKEPTLATQRDNEVANYWIKSARNTLIGNSAAGSSGSGFWYDHVADGPTTFRGNVAHAAAGRGVNMDFNRESGLLVERAPASEQEDLNPIPLDFSDSTFFHNAVGLWPSEGGRQNFRNFVLADQAGFPMVLEGAFYTLTDMLFVGSTREKNPAFVLPPVHVQYSTTATLVRPTFANFGALELISVNDIFVPWQADLSLRDVRFVNSDPRQASLPLEATNSAVIEFLDDSYMPKGFYAGLPQLVGQGAARVSIGAGEDAISAYRGTRFQHALLSLAYGGRIQTPNSMLVRSDGLRYGEPFELGYEVIFDGGFGYQLEAAPAVAEFALFLNLQTNDAPIVRSSGAPGVLASMPVSRAPSGVFFSAQLDEGARGYGDYAAPKERDRLSAASSLPDFKASPTGRYFYDANTHQLHVLASERWVVIRP